MIKRFNILDALGKANKLSFKEIYRHHYLYTYLYEGEELYAFFSYNKLICIYAPNQCQLALDNNNWDCSKTTTKYFAKFVNEYTCFDYINKTQFMHLIRQENELIKLYTTDRWHH